MRQTLSRALFVAAAATSILPLYGGAAFADSRSDVPPNACGSPSATGASLNPSLEKHCDAGPNPHAAARNFDNSENFTRLGRSHAGGSAGADEAGYGDDETGYGDDGGYGDDETGYGDDGGYGDDETGYGDDSGYGDDGGGYGDTPTTPPTTQPPRNPGGSDARGVRGTSRLRQRVEPTLGRLA